MIVLGAIAAMLGMMVVFMLSAGLFFMWRLSGALHGVEYQLSEVAKCLREDLEAQSKPQFMMLPRGVLPPELMKKNEPPPSGATGSYL